MSPSKSAMLIVALIIFSPFSVFTEASISDSNYLEITDSENYDGNWFVIQNATLNTYALSESSGYIHSPLGSFDPLEGFIPLGPENFIDFNAFLKTGMAIIQSKSSDMTSLTDALNKENNISILDSIPDDSLIIRISGEDKFQNFLKISKFSEVRWIGELPIAIL